MSTVGRPRLLDENKLRDICTILSVGGTREMAAAYVGCHPKTIWNTARRDPAFAERLRHAELSPEITFLTALKAAASDPKQWRVAAWALERLYPARYGKRAAETLTPDRVAKVLEQFVTGLVSQTPGGAHRRRLWRRLETVISNLTSSTARRSRVRKPNVRSS